MKCGKCGAEGQNGRFCESCGAELTAEEDRRAETAEGEQTKEKENTSQAAENSVVENPENPENSENSEENKDYEDHGEEEKSDEVKEALHNLDKYEQGTIPEPSSKPKPKKKQSFIYPKNPMLWSFLWLLLFGAVLGVLSYIFFKTDLDGKETFFGVTFAIFTAAVIGIDFAYYFPSALQLDRLLKGKGARLEYGLKNYELIDLAEKAKKRNRGFYLAIGLFGLAFAIYYTYILATTAQQTTLMWISLIFSISVFVICGALFFIMPKFNYGRMMANGSRVIIGNKSVYYGGTYYHWRKVQPDATFGNVNTKKHLLEITFTQEFKNGRSKKQRVTVYAPDTALKGITKLLSEYERDNKKYREKKEQQSIVDGKPVK